MFALFLEKMMLAPFFLEVKSALTEISAQKRKFQSSANKLYTDRVYNNSLYTEFAFYQIQQREYCQKRYKYPKKKIHPLTVYLVCLP